MERKDSLLDFAGAVASANIAGGSIDGSCSGGGGDDTNNGTIASTLAQQRQPAAVGGGGGRRSRKLFPTQQSVTAQPVRRGGALGRGKHHRVVKDGRRHVHWNKSIEVYVFLADYTPEETRKIWWQKPQDFTEMQMVAQFIGQASLDENVRRWFESHYRQQHSKGSASSTHTSHEDKFGVHVVNEYVYDGDEEDDGVEGGCCFLPPWCARSSTEKNGGDSLVPSPNHLPARKIRRGSVARVADDRWWHQYGHSRRGVENIGTKEGMERLRRIVDTRRQVVAEYRRQVMLGRYDPVQLSLFYRRRSLWSRDLAVAAGASDADAVKTDFAEKRHTREFYLMKKLLTKGVPAHEAENMPAFMYPPGGLPEMQSAARGINGGAGKKMEESKLAPPKETTLQRAGKTVEKLKDAPNKGSTLAKQASGLGAGGASMGAVLSGMGNSSRRLLVPLEKESPGRDDADLEG